MIVRRVLGLAVGFDSADAEMRSELDELSGMFPSADQEPDFWFSANPEGDSCVIRQDGKWPYALEREHAFSLIMQWLLAEITRRVDFALVHGGVVERGGEALILPAMTGKGKSTLTTALLHQGFRFCSDELAPFADGRRVSPYPVPIRIRQGALGRLGGLRPDLRVWQHRMFRKGEWTRFLLPSDETRFEGSSLPVGMVVFPDGHHDLPDPVLSPVTPGLAALRMMSELLGERSGTTDHFELCVDVTGSVPCYDVVAGDPHQTAEAVARTWEAR